MKQRTKLRRVSLSMSEQLLQKMREAIEAAGFYKTQQEFINVAIREKIGRDLSLPEFLPQTAAKTSPAADSSEPRAVGRPAIPQNLKQARMRGEVIQKRLNNLYAMDEFYRTALAGFQAELDAAIKQGDIESIERWHIEQPWQLRKQIQQDIYESNATL